MGEKGRQARRQEVVKAVLIHAGGARATANDVSPHHPHLMKAQPPRWWAFPLPVVRRQAMPISRQPENKFGRQVLRLAFG